MCLLMVVDMANAFPSLFLPVLVEGTVNNNCRKLPCDKTRFDAAVYEYCVLQFNLTMATTDYQLKCPWPTVRQYVYIKQFLSFKI